MAQDLQGLLNRIQDEGIKKAETERERLLAAAKVEADKLVADAKAQAASIVAEAQAEKAKLEQSGASSVRQAARDIQLALEAEISKMLQQLVADLAGQALTAETLGSMLVAMTTAYASKGGAGGVQVLLSPESAATLETQVRGALAAKLQGGVTLKPVPSLGRGMKVRFEGQGVVHDLTADAIAEMLCAYLNPRLVSILRASDSE